MSLQSGTIASILSICVIGCNFSKERKNNIHDPLISFYINAASNTQLPTAKRLDFALKAESEAGKASNLNVQLNSEKIIGTLYLRIGKTDLAQKYFIKMSEIADRLSDKTNLGIALNNRGLVFNELAQYDSAFKYYNAANKLFNALNDKLHYAQGLVNIGIIYKNQGNFEEAFKLSLEAAKIFESIGASKDLPSLYTTLGNVLKELNRSDEALIYHTKAMQMWVQQKDSAGMASSLNNIGNIYRNKRDYFRALSFYLRALNIKERLALSKTLATTIDNIAESYLELRNYNKAEFYFLKALKIRKAIDDKDGFLSTLNRLAALYLQKSNLSKAMAIAHTVLLTLPSTGYLKQRLDNYLLLSEIFRRQGEYKLSTDYYKQGLQLKDSMFNSEMAEAVSRMNARFKTEQKEKELLMSKRLQTEQHNQIRTQAYFILLLISILLSLLAIIVLLYRSNKFRKQAKSRVETLMTELNHRVKNNLQIISDILQLQIYMTKEEEHISVMQACISRIRSMNIIHNLLYNEGYTGYIDISKFIESLVSNIITTYQINAYKFEVVQDIKSVAIPIGKAISLGLIVNELITNIFKYGVISEKPVIQIQLHETGQAIHLIIADNCKYWSIQEAKRRSKGLGLMLVETIVKQIDGSWKTNNGNAGTTQIIEFRKKD